MKGPKRDRHAIGARVDSSAFDWSDKHNDQRVILISPIAGEGWGHGGDFFFDGRFAGHRTRGEVGTIVSGLREIPDGLPPDFACFQPPTAAPAPDEPRDDADQHRHGGSIPMNRESSSSIPHLGPLSQQAPWTGLSEFPP